jgi:outer membrane protein OmpA-like peptidoglycan-associated protein
MKSLTRGIFNLVFAMAFAVFATSAHAKADLDYERLRSSLNALSADPILGPLAPAERILAEQAVQALVDKSTRGKDHAHQVYIAERRVDTAYAAAQAADQERKLSVLDREHDQILLAASRRDAEQARLEAEKQRIQSLAQAEETDRLRAEADAAREQSEQDAVSARAQATQAKRLADAQAREADLARQEAKLMAATGADVRDHMNSLRAASTASGSQMTLDDMVFVAGQTSLRPEAKANFGNVVNFVNSNPTSAIRIEGHTDTSGNARLNQAVSQKRADVVRAALIAAGVDGKRITAQGLGSAQPIAENGTEEGRAKNRRVEVILTDR